MQRVPVRLSLLRVGWCRHLECLALRGGRLAPVKFPALAALIHHPIRGPMLFDTGYAEHFHSETEPFPERLYRWVTPPQLPPEQRLASQLARHGYTPGDIRGCIVSHWHGDHIAGLKDLPTARVFALGSGYFDLVSGGRLRQLIHGTLPGLVPADLASRFKAVETCPEVTLPAPWNTLGPGRDLVGDGSLLGIELPGHAAGHLGVLLRDLEGRDVLLAADASWSERAILEDLPPSFWARAITHDWPLYLETLHRLHALATRHQELVLLPSHCGVSLARYEASLPLRGSHAA
jgi:glyoxylase-like metal-dependent hydrolase (beta-lactamase superfamily II)